VGEATKLAGRMLDSDKIYDFTIRFGEQTDTLDREGAIVATSDVRPTMAAVQAVLPQFTGPIEQVPPAYSAIKIDGQRAYDLARAGTDVAMVGRSVTIHALTVRGERSRDTQDEPLPTALEPNGTGLMDLTLTANVSKGTYIRSLARDIAHALGTVGHVTMLRRTKAGPFTLESAISLDKLDEAARGGGLQQLMLPLTAGLDDIPALPVTSEQATALRQGRVLDGGTCTQGLMLAMDGETPVALVESLVTGIRVVRGFNL